jgi:hypothetical protein
MKNLPSTSKNIIGLIETEKENILKNNESIDPKDNTDIIDVNSPTKWLVKSYNELNKLNNCIISVVNF